MGAFREGPEKATPAESATSAIPNGQNRRWVTSLAQPHLPKIYPNAEEKYTTHHLLDNRPPMASHCQHAAINRPYYSSVSSVAQNVRRISLSLARLLSIIMYSRSVYATWTTATATVFEINLQPLFAISTTSHSATHARPLASALT